MRRLKLAPFQLITLYFAGLVMLCSGCALMDALWLPHQFHSTSRRSFPLAIVILGGILAWKSHSALRDGIRLERWSQEELRRPRAFLEHPTLRKLGKVLAAGAIIVWLVDAVKMFTRPGYSTHVYMCQSIFYFASLTMVSRRLLAEPGASRRDSFIDTIVPPHSEHWGR